MERITLGRTGLTITRCGFGGIPVSVMLHARSVIKPVGKAAVEGAFLSPVLAAAPKCTACGQCLERCPYELPIPELIAENLDWIDRGMP